MVTIDSNGKATFHMFGVIGEDFWTGEGVTAKGLSDALAASGIEPGAELEVLIHSPGGDVFEGLAIKAILDEYATRAVVMGLAASMASVIAVSCDELEMVEGSELMLHNPWSMVAGDAEELRKKAEHLDKIKTDMVLIYGKRFDSDAIAGIMDNETWISSSEAIEMGVADRIRKGKASAMAFVQDRETSKSRYLIAAKADPRTAKMEEQMKSHLEAIAKLKEEHDALKSYLDTKTAELETVQSTLQEVEKERAELDKELSITVAKLDNLENETARRIALSAHEPVEADIEPEPVIAHQTAYDKYKSITDKHKRAEFFRNNRAEILRTQK